MRTLMRTLTGLLALLVMGATTAAAGVGGSLDASGAGSVAADPVSATAGGRASAPPPPDVDALVAEAEAQASATQELAMEGAAEASSTLQSNVDGTSASANAAAEGSANAASDVGATTENVSADAEASAEAAVEPDTSFLGWLRAKLTALVTSVKARVESTAAAEPQLPDVDANVDAAADGLVKVGDSSVAGGLTGTGSATANGVKGSAEGVLAGGLGTPALPDL